MIGESKRPAGARRKRGRGLRPTRAELGAAALSGVLFAVAFPPLPLAVAAFVCLIPLAVSVGRAADSAEGAVGSAARVGAWFGVIAYGLSLYWIGVALSLFTSQAWLAYAATVVGMAGLCALTTTALYHIRRLTRWPLAVLLPATWVSFEILLVYFSDLAFPWFPLGLAMATHPALAQIADLSGVHGVSVWIAATNGLLADAWMVRTGPGRGKSDAPRRAIYRLLAAAGLAVAVFGYGSWRERSLPLRPLGRVGIVQPNISEDQKMQRAIQGRFIVPLAALTRQEEAADHPQLVVWPETSLPDLLANHPDWSDSLRSVAGTGHAPILFGMIDIVYTGAGPSDFDYFNAATVVDTAGRIGAEPAYHKEYLVPIVERVPFLNPRWFAALRYFGGFSRGKSTIPFNLPVGRVGVLICYESIFPQQARRFRRAGADMIVNITNDAWFGPGLAPYQHEAHLRLRAIETRAGIVRAANTGISEYIDPLGRPHGATPLFETAARTYDVETTSVRSLYVIAGDWLGSACVVLTLTLLAIIVIRRRLV
jgi:apolipoprotein N-acyltransferase